MNIQIRECTDSACLFRFPQPAEGTVVKQCPLCGGDTQIAVEYQTDLEAANGSGHPVDGTDSESGFQGIDEAVEGAAGLSGSKTFNCDVVLDNLRSVFNVGSIFRSCDGVGVGTVHLTGTTPTPEHPRFAKTALGTEQTIVWQYHRNAVRLVQAQKARGRFIVGLESGEAYPSLYDRTAMDELMIKRSGSSALLLVVGNEVGGIDPGVLAQCDMIVGLPMAGMKSSLNVAVAFGIAIYHLRFASGLLE